MNPLIKNLILTIVSQYRLHRETCTGFNWKFFHLGPWAREFDPIVEELVRTETLLERASTKQEYDTKFFQVAEARYEWSLLDLR